VVADLGSNAEAETGVGSVVAELAIALPELAGRLASEAVELLIGVK
jgi:hypothetical protein